MTKPVYGPPGSTFDWQGNVYFDLGNGEKEFLVFVDGAYMPVRRDNEFGSCGRMCGL